MRVFVMATTVHGDEEIEIVANLDKGTIIDAARQAIKDSYGDGTDKELPGFVRERAKEAMEILAEAAKDRKFNGLVLTFEDFDGPLRAVSIAVTEPKNGDPVAKLRAECKLQLEDHASYGNRITVKDIKEIVAWNNGELQLHLPQKDLKPIVGFLRGVFKV
jgi:hypothetical protein